LDELRKGELRELYTDYPVAGQLSLDILLKTGPSGTIAKERSYEVKTGQKFKNDAPTHKQSEVRDVVKSFHKFSAASANFEGIITFTNGSGRGLLQYTGPASILRESRRLDETSKAAATSLISLLRMTELRTQRATLDFFKKVRFDELRYTNNETWSTVDEHISAHITAIAQSLGADARAYELPNEYLISKLYYIAQKYTGTGENAAEHLTKEVQDFMVLRKMLANYPSPPEPPARLRQQTLDQVRMDMISNFRVGDLLPVTDNEVSVSDDATGGEISV
jgi:hypothetical protein